MWACYPRSMRGVHKRFPRGCSLLLSLAFLAGCSQKSLTDGGVPAACDGLALPHRCDVCSTGETVCAHFVVRNGVCVAETCPLAPSLPDGSASIVDGGTEAPTQVGPSYDCGPADAGLRCSCGLEPISPRRSTTPDSSRRSCSCRSRGRWSPTTRWANSTRWPWGGGSGPRARESWSASRSASSSRPTIA